MIITEVAPPVEDIIVIEFLRWLLNFCEVVAKPGEKELVVLKGLKRPKTGINVKK